MIITIILLLNTTTTTTTTNNNDHTHGGDKHNVAQRLPRPRTRRARSWVLIIISSVASMHTTFTVSNVSYYCYY